MRIKTAIINVMTNEYWRGVIFGGFIAVLTIAVLTQAKIWSILIWIVVAVSMELIFGEEIKKLREW